MIEKEVPAETVEVEKPPNCYRQAYCHIRRFWKKKVYDNRSKAACEGCLQDNPNEYPKNFIGREERLSI